MTLVSLTIGTILLWVGGKSEKLFAERSFVRNCELVNTVTIVPLVIFLGPCLFLNQKALIMANETEHLGFHHLCRYRIRGRGWPNPSQQMARRCHLCWKLHSVQELSLRKFQRNFPVGFGN